MFTATVVLLALFGIFAWDMNTGYPPETTYVALGVLCAVAVVLRALEGPGY